jgi:hypothetical protein
MPHSPLERGEVSDWRPRALRIGAALPQMKARAVVTSSMCGRSLAVSFGEEARSMRQPRRQYA